MRSSNSSEEVVEWDELVSIGTVARTQGRRGEVLVNPLTDFPGRFGALGRVFVEAEDGRAEQLRIETFREHGRRPVLKFEGVSDISGAEALAGKELRILESELTRLPEGSYYHFEIEGCDVWDRRYGHLGKVEEVMTTGGTDVLVVRRAGEELLVPLCAQICLRIAVGEKRIDIEAPEGLLTINAH